ncbi:hypothetical protein UFOVP815_16 [uncultured Caudovirales phage]|uniref:Uncharacterized protein n=1 Tax=uncultured Caudovirales phage TaxID=2100421 RepID=A0A6J5P595_9CAUD|nr:hypothetical protein UFOVP815_16 [uncultured Caudovirales phage]
MIAAKGKRVRDWSAEHKARKLRKLLNSIDPTRRTALLQPTVAPVMQRDTYTPPKVAPTRPGSDTFLKIKSKGIAP